MKRSHIQIISAVTMLLVSSCNITKETEDTPITEEQAIELTRSRPIQKQWKGTYEFDDVYFSNEFDGARLSGVLQTGDSTFTILISAENYPINPSPWYAFKVWGDSSKRIRIRFTYLEARNRYYPMISRNGVDWDVLDSARYLAINPGTGTAGIKSSPKSMEITIDIDADPIWIAAQELYSSSRVFDWMEHIGVQTGGTIQRIGSSIEGRDINLLSFGNKSTGRSIFIISRQHPPEVTGFLAMKAFMETIADTTSRIANEFRSAYAIYNVPMMNPDGVDNGHWRHNAGGVDLNRDWTGFNQPETKAVRKFLRQKKSEQIEFLMGIDFHSTWKDVYYPIDSTLTEPELELAYTWLNKIDGALSNYSPNIKPADSRYPDIYSRNFFTNRIGMSSVIFEVGDNTSRDFINRKGRVAAIELMNLLLEEPNLADEADKP